MPIIKEILNQSIKVINNSISLSRRNDEFSIMLGIVMFFSKMMMWFPFIMVSILFYRTLIFLGFANILAIVLAFILLFSSFGIMKIIHLKIEPLKDNNPVNFRVLQVLEIAFVSGIPFLLVYSFMSGFSNALLSLAVSLSFGYFSYKSYLKNIS